MIHITELVEIDDEIMTVTGIAGNVFFLTRPVPVAHANNSETNKRPTSPSAAKVNPRWVPGCVDSELSQIETFHLSFQDATF